MQKETSPATSESASAGRGGRPRKLSAQAVDTLRTLALEHPNATVDDLRILVEQQLGVSLCQLSVYRYLKRAGIQRQRSGILEWPRKKQRSSGFVPAAPPRYGYTQSHRDPGGATRYPGSLTDAEWELVADLFEHSGPGKPLRYPRRTLVDACCYVVRTGYSWRMLP